MALTTSINMIKTKFSTDEPISPINICDVVSFGNTFAFMYILKTTTSATSSATTTIYNKL